MCKLDAVFAAAQPLDVADRDLFLRDGPVALDGQVLGDGLVARTCREIQGRDFKPPANQLHPPQHHRPEMLRRAAAGA
jgi:hypothetical protein